MSSKTLIRFSKGDPEKLSFCRSHGSSSDVIFYLCMHTEWLDGREKNAKNKNDLLTTGLNDIKKKKKLQHKPTKWTRRRVRGKMDRRTTGQTLCDLYASNYLCSMLNEVSEFALRTWNKERLIGLLRDGRRGIVSIVWCRRRPLGRNIRVWNISHSFLRVTIILHLRQMKTKINWWWKHCNQQNINDIT